MTITTELGIDEAGRGPVLGPLVLAGVLVPHDKFKELTALGINDSKTFGSGKKAQKVRASLAESIKKRFAWAIEVLTPAIIDEYVVNSSLNYLEQVTAKKIMDRLKADLVVLDGATLFKPLVSEGIIARNKADKTFPSVSAASILAKAERDRLFAKSCEAFLATFGEVKGGGYANNKTLEFVKWHMERFGDLPEIFRKSYQWKALKK